MELHTFYAALSGDLAGALARMGSLECLLGYLQMLPMDESSRHLLQMRLLPREIRAEAHKLRGVAGLLGLTQLQAQAEAVENSASHPECVAATRLGELEAALRRTMAYVGALSVEEARPTVEERAGWQASLGGLPGEVGVVHAQTGRVIWGQWNDLNAADEAIWDAAWLGKACWSFGRLVWPCKPGYAFCYVGASTEPDRASVLGHDVRTPLHVIRTLTALARRSGGEMGQINRCLEGIEAAGRHLEAVINGIDSSREEVFNLQDVLSRAAAMIGEEAKEKHVRVSLRMAGDQFWVCADRACLGRVVMNLLSNAVKNTAEGGAIELRCEECGSGIYDVTVEDGGAGMSASFVRRAFEPYVKADESADGRGLGLHIVRGLVEKLGGEVFVRSRVGSGTAVRIHLTLQPVCAPADAGSLEGIRVLVVDDHALSARASASMLESLGARVTLARSGAESLRRAQGQDCVLMDIHLPDMSGYEAAQRLHLRYPSHELPILAFTAERSAESQARMIGCGMQGMVPKPVDPGELTAAILAQVHRAG